jgi:hypothetical protein
MDERLINWLMERIMLMLFYETWKSLTQMKEMKIKADRELVEKIIEHKASDEIMEYYWSREREAQIQVEILQRAADEEKIRHYFMR